MCRHGVMVSWLVLARTFKHSLLMQAFEMPKQEGEKLSGKKYKTHSIDPFIRQSLRRGRQSQKKQKP